MDIASSIQKVTEEIVLLICNNLYDEFKIENLCLAGGVALNCVANGKLLKESKFKNIWIQPAAGDAGGALGAAYAVWYTELNNPRNYDSNDKMCGSYLGPSYKKNIIEKKLSDLGAVFTEMSDIELEGIFDVWARPEVTDLINEFGDIENPIPLGIKMLREVPEFRRLAGRAAKAVLWG